MFLLMLGVPNWGSAGLVQLITAMGSGKPVAPAVCTAITILAWGGERACAPQCVCAPTPRSCASLPLRSGGRLQFVLVIFGSHRVQRCRVRCRSRPDGACFLRRLVVLIVGVCVSLQRSCCGAQGRRLCGRCRKSESERIDSKSARDARRRCVVRASSSFQRPLPTIIAKKSNRRVSLRVARRSTLRRACVCARAQAAWEHRDEIKKVAVDNKAARRRFFVRFEKLRSPLTHARVRPPCARIF